MKPRNLRIAVIAASLAAAPFAIAAGDASDKSTMDRSPTATDKPGSSAAGRSAASMDKPDAATHSDRARMKEWSGGKEQLEQALRKGEGKDFYRQEIERLGYKITALNQDKDDYLEYEIVKGGNSYEVQIDLDNGKAEKIDVTTNVWKADATERALDDANHDVAYPTTVTERYSDRDRMKVWTGERDQLEKQLKTGQSKQYYAEELKRLGYQVTAVNDNEADYLEYEVVKGGESFEVQIDFDSTGKATEVDVAPNLWKADATERALEKSEPRRTGEASSR